MINRKYTCRYLPKLETRAFQVGRTQVGYHKTRQRVRKDNAKHNTTTVGLNRDLVFL